VRQLPFAFYGVLLLFIRVSPKTQLQAYPLKHIISQVFIRVRIQL